jgi:hypothetical protein
MADTDLAKPDAPASWRRRALRVALWATGTALLVAGGGLWLARNRIADGVIADELASLGCRRAIPSFRSGRAAKCWPTWWWAIRAGPIW